MLSRYDNHALNLETLNSSLCGYNVITNQVILDFSSLLGNPIKGENLDKLCIWTIIFQFGSRM